MFFRFLIVGMIIYFMIRLTRSFILHCCIVSTIKQYSSKMFGIMIDKKQEYVINKTKDRVMELATPENEMCLKIKAKFETGTELSVEELSFFSGIMREYLEEIANKEIRPKLNRLGFYKRVYEISDYEDGSYEPTFFDYISILLRGTFAYDYRDIIDEVFFNEMSSLIEAK